MEIWGWKTVALMDVWSFEHFLSGVTAGVVGMYVLRKKPHQPFKFIGFVLGGAYLWELIEYNLEIGHSGIEAVTYWFQGVEYWANRLITDPAMALLGSWVALKYQSVRLPARFASLLWLGVHVFIFPHCMYLHTLF